MRKARKIAILLSSIVFLLMGCGNLENNHTEKEPKEQKIQIGMIFDSFVIERWQRDRDVFVSMAKELGAEVNIQNANGDVEEQKKQIDYFIKKGMDAIVIIPIDSDGLRDSVKKAHDAGIIVISYDRLVKNANTDLYISFDNEKVGEMMAQSFVDQGVAGGSVLMLGGPNEDNNVHLVEKGFQNVCADNNITIVDAIHAKGWKAEEAANYLYEHEELVSHVDAIMCGNDDLASAVVPVLAERRLAGEICVSGQDADLRACQRIVEGTQLMTVYKPVEKLARRAAECTVLLVQGKEIEGEDVSTINDDTYEIPYVRLEPIAVDESNIDEVIIDSGFHLKEDVYLNTPGKKDKG